MHWFLSYSRRSSDQCQVTLNALLARMEKHHWEIAQAPGTGARHTLFMDRALDLGGWWKFDLLSQLDSCDGGLLFLTPDISKARTGRKHAEQMYERSVIFAEVYHLVMRKHLGKIPLLVPLFVGTNAREHGVFNAEFLPIQDLQAAKLTPGETDPAKLDSLILELERLAAGIPAVSQKPGADPLIQDFLSEVPPKEKFQAIVDFLVPVGGGDTAVERRNRVSDHLAERQENLDQALARLLRAGPLQDDRDEVYFYLRELRKLTDSYREASRKDQQAGVRENIPTALKEIWVPCERLTQFRDCLHQGSSAFAFLADIDEIKFDGLGTSEIGDAVLEALKFARSIENDAPPRSTNVSEIVRVMDPTSLRRDFNQHPGLIRIEERNGGLGAVIDDVLDALVKARAGGFVVVVTDWKGWLMKSEDPGEYATPQMLISLRSRRSIPRIERVMQVVRSRHRETLLPLVFLSCLPNEGLKWTGKIKDVVNLYLPISWRQEVGESFNDHLTTRHRGGTS